MVSSIVKKFLSKNRVSYGGDSVGFNVQQFKSEFIKKVEEVYGEMIKMKLQILRPIEVKDSFIPDDELESLKEAYKQLDKVTDELEKLLAQAKGIPS